MPVQFGKCQNRSKCSLGYTGAPIRFDGEPRCPECGALLTVQRGPGRSRNVWLLAGILLVILLGTIVGVILFGPRFSSNTGKVVQAEVAPTPTPASTGAEFAENATPELPPELREQPAASAGSASPATSVVEKPVPKPSSALTPVPPTPEEKPTVSVKPPELPREQVDATREDVVKRINAMPRITASEKERLIEKMQTAHLMERLRVIRFDRGQSAVPKPAGDELIKSLADSDMQQKLSDPTLILVVAGYADLGGDAKTNQRISEERAENVGRLLKQRGQVLNVVHTLGMGSTELLDGKRPDQNRAVEIWGVVP